jgi:hypothetical protein
MEGEKKSSLAAWQAQYASWRDRLAKVGWISEGYV